MDKLFRGSKADELLTLLFMVLAIAAVVCYFAVSNKMVFMYLAGIAIVIRLAQYILRYFK
ncbi:MAG: hypothetical protein LBF62_15315 [Tannerellaceae bacterium]|jgi:hypothetical protein|nr:hypothetical protein [Tannerellaceae bacterium]